MQLEESTIEPKQQEASMLEESPTVNEDPKLDEVKIVDMPIPLIEFVIPDGIATNTKREKTQTLQHQSTPRTTTNPHYGAATRRREREGKDSNANLH